jgi:peptidoglycan hydrolase CwlO-like protein
MHRPTPTGTGQGSRLLLRAALGAAGLAVVAAAMAALVGSAAPATERLDARREQIRALEAELARIDAAATEAADAHAAAVREQDALRARIAQTRAALAEARAAHAVSVQRLSDRVVALYRADDPSLVEILLTSGSISDALDARGALERIGRNDSRIVAQLRETKGRLAALEAELEQDRGRVARTVAERADRLGDLEGLIGDRRAVLDDAQAELAALIAAEEQRRDRAAAQARAERAVAAAEEEAEQALRRRAAPAPADPAPATSAAPAGAPEVSAPADVAAHLERIAQCESGGNPRAVSSSGLYRGKYQFAVSTWEGLGGVGDPAAAPEAEQDRLAALLYARSGPAPWPVCGYR